MIEELLTFAWNACTEFGKQLGIKAISQKDIIDFFPSAQMRESFQQRVKENAAYVSLDESVKYNDLFSHELGYGEVKPAYKFFGQSGLLHVSEIDHKRIDDVNTVFKVGDKVSVKIIGTDPKTGKLRPSRKARWTTRGKRTIDNIYL